MDSSQVSIFEEGDEVSLSSLLKSHHSGRLETEIGLKHSHAQSLPVISEEAYLEILSNLTNQPLEGQLADQELRRLLVPSDLTESDGTRTEPVRLLHTTSSSLQNKVKFKEKD
jgi:hypothetical protein